MPKLGSACATTGATLGATLGTALRATLGITLDAGATGAGAIGTTFGAGATGVGAFGTTFGVGAFGGGAPPRFATTRCVALFCILCADAPVVSRDRHIASARIDAIPVIRNLILFTFLQKNDNA